MAVKDGFLALRTAAWLGWQMESNWTDPFLFAVYSVVKPLAGTLIIVFMYRIVGSGSTDSAYFASMYVGNAFFALVGQVFLGLSWVVIEDREFFRMIRYVYVSPAPYNVYLTGRALSKVVIAAVSVLVLLLVGKFALGIPLSVSTINWPLLVLMVSLGLISSVGIGMHLGALMLFMARHGGSASEGLAGVLYLACGVLYPISVLPPALRAVSRAIPLTYWIEGIRRAVLGEEIARVFSATSMSTSSLLITLSVSSLVFLASGFLFWRHAEYCAKYRGNIDLAQDY